MGRAVEVLEPWDAKQDVFPCVLVHNHHSTESNKPNQSKATTMVHPYLLAKQPSGAKVSRYNRKTGKIEAPETPPAPAPAAGGNGKSGDAALNLLSAASALASLEGPPPLPGQEVPFAPGAAAAAAAAADQQMAGIETSDQSPRGKPTADRSPSNNKRFPDLVSLHSTNLDRAPRILCPRGGELYRIDGDVAPFYLLALS